MTNKRITLALTGASGAQYGICLLEQLLRQGCEVSFLISRAAQVVMATETELKMPGTPAELQLWFAERYKDFPGSVKVYGREQWMAPVASGSGAPTAMVVCPCSTGTLSAIAGGASNNLIERAADVALKERRKLILVPREAPYSEIHLENMLRLTRMGAVILPASPGFYNKPTSVEQMVEFVVARILDQLGIPQDLVSRWGE